MCECVWVGRIWEEFGGGETIQCKQFILYEKNQNFQEKEASESFICFLRRRGDINDTRRNEADLNTTDMALFLLAVV